MVSLINIILWILQIYSFVLVAYALLSWLPGAYDSALGHFLASICEPFLSIFRRLPLQFAGFDFSIWVAFIFLSLLQRFIAQLFYGFL